MSKFSYPSSFSMSLLIALSVGYASISSSMAEEITLPVSEVSSEPLQVTFKNTQDNSNQINQPQKTAVSNRVITNLDAYRKYGTEDNLMGLIHTKQQQFIEGDRRLSRQDMSSLETGDFPSIGVMVYEMDFNRWLNALNGRSDRVARYRNYLASQLNGYNVPPMEQLLTTARSWQSCGYEPYQIPPEYLWPNMVNTLRLYAVLRQQGILPASTQIRSVYRPPDLNDCAGGASGSKHMLNGAIDIWVPEYQNNEWMINNLQNGLCNFWAFQGEEYNFGLGLYSTGSIHIDTQGYRKWGSSHSSDSSPCRL